MLLRKNQHDNTMNNVKSIIKPELLAPAGSFVSLQAGLQSGCDAVYFGVADFNMRQAATNFGVTDFQEVSARCKQFDAKQYLTLNTIVFPAEKKRILEILDVAAAYVDGVIAWDPLVLQGCREREIPIHISTQASVSNVDAARMYQSMGAVRIVPARECTLDELMTIKSEVGMALEVFIHGAMCVSVSGRCYLSDLTHGKSGNRGECQQNCRREYEIKDLQEGHTFVLGNHYVMSAQDLCTLPFIQMLCDAQIDAFKIEGRGRNAEYVRTVVSVYRRAIDSWAQGDLCQEYIAKLMAELKTVYNRTFCDGFIFGRPISSFVDAYGGKATLKKEYIGVVTNFYRKAKVVEVLVQDCLFDTSSKLMIQGETTGVVDFTVREIRQHEQSVAKAKRGVVTFPLEQRVRVGDKMYRLVDRMPNELFVRP